MAIKIIQKIEPKDVSIRISCNHCTSVLEYGYSDIKFSEPRETDNDLVIRGYHYIQCPVCRNIINVKPARL